MELRVTCRVATGLIFGAMALPIMRSQPAATAAETGPVELRVDDLATPLGIDDPAPRFSWQLHDETRGAK